MHCDRQWAFLVSSICFISDCLLITFIAVVFKGKRCLVRAGLVYVLLRDSLTHSHTAEVMFRAHTQGKAAHLLRWMSVWCWKNSVSHPSGSVPALLVTWPDVGLKQGHGRWRVFLWIFHGMCWATRVWNNDKNNCSCNNSSVVYFSVSVFKHSSWSKLSCYDFTLI